MLNYTDLLADAQHKRSLHLKEAEAWGNFIAKLQELSKGAPVSSNSAVNEIGGKDARDLAAKIIAEKGAMKDTATMAEEFAKAGYPIAKRKLLNILSAASKTIFIFDINNGGWNLRQKGVLKAV